MRDLVFEPSLASDEPKRGKKRKQCIAFEERKPGLNQ
jgi:hypothetical protein